METATPIRRVYKREIRARTGWSESWLRQQIKRGHWPPGMHDVGSRRIFWLSDTVDGALARLNASATTERVPTPAEQAAA
jgi:predicted DNA-binding transcriptional regulator AlpA